MDNSQIQPLPNGSNGRCTNGRFAKGNPGGPGNPRAKQVAVVRSMLREAVTGEDVRAIVRMLVDRAKGGDVAAARELLNRIFGKPHSLMDPDRLALEKQSLYLRERMVEVAEDKI